MTTTAVHSREGWWRRAAFALAIMCVAAPLAARALAGPPGGRVHVRWHDTVDSATREQLETQYRLLDRAQLDGGTWRYDLIDPRTEVIRALVNDSAVVDTHDIDRGAYTLDPAAVRTSRRQRFAAGDALVAAADGVSAVLAIAAILVVAIGRAGHGDSRGAAVAFAVRTGGRFAAPAADWLHRGLGRGLQGALQRGIPAIDARTAGIFRILFGLAVLIFFQLEAVDASRLAPSFDSLAEGELHLRVLEWLRAHPAVVTWLSSWLLVTGAAFTVGLFTRTAYALFVAGALVWAFVAVSFDSTHPHSTLMLTLVALLPSRWGDRLSVDAWLRKRPVPMLTGRRYGYTVWVPGLVVGVAFAAAAWSKLAGPESWTTWVMNGSVKYHFITDSVNAPVDWGLQLAAHPRLAILASLGAVVIEALAITAAFSRSEAYRLGMGLASLGLVAGFRLFMGVMWLGWWIPLLAFLPWQRLSSRVAVWGEPSRLASRTQRVRATTATWSGLSISRAQLFVVIAVIAQQLVVSALSIERAPMFTDYPMYSYTFDSPEEFNAWLPANYRIVVATDRGTRELQCTANDDLVREFQAALRGSREAHASVTRAIHGCRGQDVAGARQVVLEEDRQTFDWERLVLTTTRAAAVHGPLRVDAVTATPVRY